MTDTNTDKTTEAAFQEWYDTRNHGTALKEIRYEEMRMAWNAALSRTADLTAKLEAAASHLRIARAGKNLRFVISGIDEALAAIGETNK